jgi:hypothetical protein
VNTKTLPLIFAIAFSPLFSGPVLAHHSMSMYDRSHDTTFKAVHSIGRCNTI